MWSFHKKIENGPKIYKAIAYLKSVAPFNGKTPTIQLPKKNNPVFKILNKYLLVTYLVDTGKIFEYVQYQDLHKNSLTENEMHNIGIHNLTTLAETGNLRIAPYGNIFAVLLDGNFEASMLLLDSLWNDSFRQFVDGEYLVAVPNRDILAFCDKSSVAGRAELLGVLARSKSLHAG